MSSVLPEVMDVEYRRMKRFIRLVLIVTLSVPVYFYGPLIWKDGSYAGRWVFAADISERPVECRGAAYFLQLCEVRFVDRLNNRFVKLDYLIIGTDWSEAATDIVRSSEGHLTGAIGVTAHAILMRIGALFSLVMLGFIVEWIVRRIKYLSLQNRLMGQTIGARRREAVMLSRDRRDHF